jgi:maltose alpha-D-glucosyltransferase/alpha-amylase
MDADPLWYKDAIIYQLHVKAFFDANDDGVGDFQGLRAKLDYIQDLGVTAIWLLPFYPSPLRDDGYDIADYRAINSSYGSMADFRAFLREANRRDLRVITELVVNHTSDQHPWFQRARHARPGSAARNYYVWSDTDQRYLGTRIIFTDTETSNWAWDPAAKAYYWHRFFSHQPDLNFDNPRVIEAIIRVMRFWLDMGIDGMRLDALPYLCEREGTNNENLAETHVVVRKLRAALDERYDDKMLLAEANQWPEDVLPYFGDGDECHMAFHFPLMPRIYMAVAQEDRHPITDIMRQTPDIPDNCQWAVFLRNHDELTLEMVTDSERDYLWDTYAAEPRARLNLGIRRRLAPLLDNDRRKIELLKSLLMSMPGTPIMYYGDEIGMGDNVYLGDRDGVRTPMQWTPDRNGGFSRADPARLYLPPVMDPVYGYEARNVEAQRRDSSSLLNWTKRLIAAHRQHLAFGRGTLRFLYPGNRKVLAYLRQYDDETILCVANLSRAPQPVELDLSEFKGRVPVELLGNSAFPPIGELPYFITLASYGFYWFILAMEAEAPSWHEALTAPLPELRTLVIPRGWASLGEGSAREELEMRILPEFLRNQRWFGAKDGDIGGVRQQDRATLGDGETGWSYVLYEVSPKEADVQIYALPQSITWERVGKEGLVALLPWTICRVRQGPSTGVLYDAIGDDDFARALVGRMLRGESVSTDAGGRIIFASSSALRDSEALLGLDAAPVQRLGREQSNTSVLLERRAVLKLYRRLQSGVHPEIEIGRHLTDVAEFRNAPALLGTVEYASAAGTPLALGVLQEYVENQGDGWEFTLDYLDRKLEEIALTVPEEYLPEEQHAALIQRMRTLGQRTAELHRAFAIDTDDEAFTPAPIERTDIERWIGDATRQIGDAISALDHAFPSLEGEDRAAAEALLTVKDELLDRPAQLMPESLPVVKTRHHGDFHLGQVVVAKSDFYILDFEGEPTRPLAERRRKHLPVRDVAGMLRSFDYAAWSAVMARESLATEQRDGLLRWAMDWRNLTEQAFLAGYADAIGDCPSYPADAAQARSLIDFFALEKACYEICYEAANRPDWLRIPVNGVAAMLQTEAGAPEG